MSSKAMGDADREVSLFSLCKYDVLVTCLILIRPQVGVSRLITSPIFAPSSLRRMIVLIPTQVRKKRVMVISVKSAS